MNYYLAIDIGASSGRHLIGWLENGKIMTEEIYRFENLPKSTVCEYGGDTPHLTWDVPRLYNEILAGLKVAKDIGKIPVSVGIDTWGVDYALLDENDKLIDKVYCYRDFRADAAMEKVHAIMPPEELYRITGIQIGSINTIYQLYCDKISGRMEKAKSFLMLPDYLGFLLTGVKRQEYTNSTTTGMINTVTHTWDEEIIEKLGYKKELFGTLTAPGTVLGDFSESVAEFVGYQAKITTPATHDTASAVLAAPLDSEAPYISSGTWSLLGIEQANAHTDKVAFESNYSNEGSINNTFRLQKNIMGLWIIQQIRHETGDKYSFAELADMARRTPSNHKIDVNDKRFLAPENMTEEVRGAVGEELTVAEMAHVVYNSLAHSYLEALDDLEKITGKKYSTLNIIGGGSKNAFLNELTAKHTGKKVITGPAEGTAIGNLMMQMIAHGDIPSVEAGRKLIKNSFDISEI